MMLESVSGRLIDPRERETMDAETEESPEPVPVFNNTS